MKYDFDEIIPRRHTNSYKWDSAADSDVLPLWVADMDFGSRHHGSFGRPCGTRHLRLHTGAR